MYRPSSRLDETTVRGTRNRQPKLLFLAYPFPPLSAVACIRTSNIAKHLARLGWEVTVVTPEPSIWRQTEDREKIEQILATEGIRRILTGHAWRMLSPTDLKCSNDGMGWLLGGVCRKIARHLGVDKTAGWISAAEQACASLTSNDVDVILATAPPFSTFTLAKRLSDRLGCPYVLDYRDLWSRNAHDPVPEATAKEAQLLARCAAVTTVSPFWGSIMDREFGLGSKLNIVTNGFDPEELQKIQPHDFGHFAIVYAGNFYPPKRVISPVMEALQVLKTKTNGLEWHFHYYGSHQSHVRDEAVRFDLADRTVIHGRVSWREALSAVKGAGVAVVITSVENDGSPEDKGIVTGKIFETLGLETRFLLIGPSDSDAAVIARDTGLGQCFSGRDIKGIAEFLSHAMHTDAPRPRSLGSYSWAALGEKVNCVLRGLIEAKKSAGPELSPEHPNQ